MSPSIGLTSRLLSVRVRVWLQLERFAERRLQHAYDRLAAHDAKAGGR